MTALRASERVIDEVAQGLRDLDEGVEWFAAFRPGEQRAVLHEIALYLMQAHVTVETCCKGLERSGVKPTTNT